MVKSSNPKFGSESSAKQTWIARDSRSGRFVEVKTARNMPRTSAAENPPPATNRRPGRFKGLLLVGPEFFESLSDNELNELNGV